MDTVVLSVTELNQMVHLKLENDPQLRNVCVRGEISNYKVYPSGHHYFTIKDPGASIRCVLFKGYASTLRFRAQNGMSVLAMGRVSLYPKDGAYQLYCTAMLPEGEGDLHVAFEQLKRQLYQAGLFDQAHKKELPEYPHTIGIVTSPAGAAVHDMLRILGKRYPLSKVILLPVRVQGPEAPGEIIRMLDAANALQLADVLIVGRGGGSIEELWAFNDEGVARAIFRSEIPVVSAVGHEPDVTISDFVADLRAATPSNAAERVAPDQTELRSRLLHLQQTLNARMDAVLTRSRQRFHTAAANPLLQNPMRYIQERRMQLDLATERLQQKEQAILAENRHALATMSAALDAMSPLRVLSRGYAVAHTKDGTIVRTVGQLKPGDPLSVRVADGKILALVEATEEEPI